jgi:diguanylate cyclase (GGDEF)-like protein
MQDLDDGVRVGRAGLSAVSADATTKVPPFIDETAVVRGAQLLDVASALSDGATLLHTRLRHLPPDDREAILDLMAGQLSSIVTLWADLVRGVVPSPGPDPLPGPHRAAESPGRGDESALPDTSAHPSASLRSGPAAGSRPDRPPTLADVWQRRAADAGGDAPGRPGPGPGPELRRLPRRDEAVPRRPAEDAQREVWATPLRSVTVDEPESDYEGDRLTRDELTGALNRQAGFAALGRELDRCRRAGERFVLGYLDVDGLKEVNGSQGPRSGDELLRKVTAALRATLRSYDVIMRLGGDEFLFSLPGADMATAELRANEFGVILAEEAPGASASVGFAELRGNDTLDEIISRAEIELVKGRRSRVRSR